MGKRRVEGGETKRTKKLGNGKNIRWNETEKERE
mgnify:CR=1 FL=1